MTCRELADFLDAYACGTLDDARRLVFDAHLAVCPDCVAYVRSYLAVPALVRRALTDPDAPVPDAPEDLIRAILAAGGQTGEA